MNKYETAYKKLKADYEKVANDEQTLNNYSPIKKVRVLKSIHGVPSETSTDMFGKALDGFHVEKKIYVNDENNVTDDDVVLLDSENHISEHYHNVGLTRLRCGLMTCVALGEVMDLLKIPQIKKVGIIGNGRTNLQNADCIHELFGVNEFVIRGSARNRSKNLDAFLAITPNVIVDDTDDYKYINDCDAVISCTSTCDPADQVSVHDIHTPRIMIALDTGYFFDESFREQCEAYTDDVDQLEAYYGEEFIFDKKKIKLKQLVEEKTVEKDRVCVYMFGISFADAEVAEMLHEHFVEV